MRQSGKIVDGVDDIDGRNFAMSGCVEVAYVEAAVGVVHGCDPCGTSRLQRSVLEQEGTPELALKLAQLPKKSDEVDDQVKVSPLIGMA